MKIAIVGSRKYENKRKIKDFVFELKNKYGSDGVTIVSGGCKSGADRYAKKYALEFEIPYEEYPPFHDVHNLYCVLPEACYGKPYNTKYFFARNKQIAKACEYVVGFIPKGMKSAGTESTLKYAHKFEKKVLIIH